MQTLLIYLSDLQMSALPKIKTIDGEEVGYFPNKEFFILEKDETNYTVVQGSKLYKIPNVYSKFSITERYVGNFVHPEILGPMQKDGWDWTNIDSHIVSSFYVTGEKIVAKNAFGRFGNLLPSNYVSILYKGKLEQIYPTSFSDADED